MKTTISALALVLSFQAHAEGWSKLTIGEESAYQVANVLDWATTNTIPRSAGWYCPQHSGVVSCTWMPHRYAEADAVWALGRFPSQARVNEYMAASAGIHLVISWALINHPYAEQVWQLVTLGLKVNDVGHNFSIGMHARF